VSKITVNLKCDYNTHVKASKIWQQLFNIFVAADGNLKHLHHLLCDYDYLQKWLDNQPDSNIIELCWSFDSFKNGVITTTFEESAVGWKLIDGDKYYKIVVDRKKEECTIEEKTFNIEV